MKKSAFTKPEPIADHPVFAFHLNSNRNQITVEPSRFSSQNNIQTYHIYHQNPFDARQYASFAMGVVR